MMVFANGKAAVFHLASLRVQVLRSKFGCLGDRVTEVSPAPLVHSRRGVGGPITATQVGIFRWSPLTAGRWGSGGAGRTPKPWTAGFDGEWGNGIRVAFEGLLALLGAVLCQDRL